MAIEIGIFSLIYSALKDLLGWLSGRFKKKPPEEIIAHRKRWKKEFESNLQWIDDTEVYGEAIIRDVRRMDSYPDVDEKEKGISPWFRVALLGLYHRGIEVGLRYESIKFDEKYNSWRFYRYKEEEADIRAIMIGRIPFDEIVEVDWEGDEYYYIPHIYCRFDQKKKEPYEETVFAEKKQGSDRPYYLDICDYDSVIRLSKKLKTGFFA